MHVTEFEYCIESRIEEKTFTTIVIAIVPPPHSFTPCDSEWNSASNDEKNGSENHDFVSSLFFFILLPYHSPTTIEPPTTLLPLLLFRE